MMNVAKFHRPQNFNFRLIVSSFFCRSIPLIFKNQIRFTFCSNRFYEILSQHKEQEFLYLSTEDNILSKFLKQPTNNKQISKKKEAISQKTKKLTVNYKDYLAKNSNGCILHQQYQSNQLLLVGLNYKNVDWRNLHKTLYKFQPEVILVQNKPQLLLNQFQVLKKNKSDQIFDDKQYINQLKIQSNILSQDIIKIMTQEKDNRTKSSQKLRNIQMFPQLRSQIVNQKALLTSLYFATHKKTQIFLGQIPQSVQRQWICNSHSLMQLQQIFKIVMKQMIFYSGLGLTPYQLASYLFPDKFLQINDKYMSTLIQMLISLGYSKIAYLGGICQNEAISDILKNKLLVSENNDIQPILTYLIPPKAKGNIIRDIQGYQIIQKHIILDMLYYSNKIMDFPLSTFKTTNKIIDHYGKKIFKYQNQNLMKFRYDATIKYTQLMKEKLKQGQKIKKKEFMRSAIRGN